MKDNFFHRPISKVAMEVPHYAATVSYIREHFEVKHIYLDVLKERILFVGKLREGSTLGLLPWKDGQKSPLVETSAMLRKDFYEYVVEEFVSTLADGGRIVELSTTAPVKDQRFYNLNGIDVPRF